MTSARRVALRALVAVDTGEVERLEPALLLHGLDRRDRDLAVELARGVERMRLTLDFVAERYVTTGLPKRPSTRAALRMGIYQLLYLARVPIRAAVHESVELVDKERGFVNAVLRRIAAAIREPDQVDAAKPTELLHGAEGRVLRFERPELPDPIDRPAAYHAIRHGLPAFVVERWARQHGIDAAIATAAASSRPPIVALRVHAPRANRTALAERLATEGVTTAPADHDAVLLWTGGGSPFESGAFRDGWFVAQDPTALRAVEAVGAQPGETVIDLCAAPGTKTTFLAAAVAPNGRVLAHDADAGRTGRIVENVARLGLRDVVTLVPDKADLPIADRALVDVPCSNTGVLARRPEVRRRLRPETFAGLARIQGELLRFAIAHVRPGGTVVYSTCSIEPEENEAVVAATLGEGCELVTQQCTLPVERQHDGGYHAVLRIRA